MILNLDTIKGLLHWFYFEADKFRSYQSIAKTCKRALWAISNEEDAKYVIYDTFFPLLRWGLVEYYGNNRFRLSPTAGVFSSNKVLVCHPPSLMSESLFPFRLSQGLPGIFLYRNCSEVADSCRVYNIPLMRFDFHQSLYPVPPLDKLVRFWDQERIIDTSSYFQFNEHFFWVKINGQEVLPGVYKKSDNNFAGKIIKLAEGEWRTVPERKQQFDGFSLAVLLSRIQNGNELGIHYLKQEKLLVVHTHFFPIILERLLSINTLLSDSPQANVSSRVYHLDNKGFILLNKVFHNAIQTK
jgi:hypothetical protein